MIRHIVLFSAREDAAIDQIIAGLSILTLIPHARRLEIARNRKRDQLGNDIDVVVYGEFDNETELAAYKAHHLYNESIRRVRPLREMRFAADYDESTDAHVVPITAAGLLVPRSD
ncbi:Dabb family protein [Bradyrhizobium canariense]|uniref:Stress responsive protein n=1 Tax=Bradyrhizobium canariense TaxID=255045 RepID=A0A1X3GMF9_9BRAD|nr:Dabb family protein [Bradyrhizobium canariense]OSI68679.1 stress responsive protein [Bradyrhizobium canariense]OSI78126.1 stress responsive protein [Bradyrhizobium canariense]OSI89355.1 stress responsive protein [Bradyrhizobium canariense]OSI93180.1 stress responsive protein [Bradyrhizobium canariense]OSJ03153.1 stress responsive protein [Bradyrhizobium canariense]